MWRRSTAYSEPEGKPQWQHPHRVPNNQQTKQTKHEKKKKTMAGQRLGRRRTEEAGHKRGKRVEEKGVKHRTKAREHQINCLVQMVDDKGRREGHPSSHLCSAHKVGG
jgi:hypothetical protein